MTPTRAAALLTSWAANAKTAESREACELAATSCRNSAMAHEALFKSGKRELNIQFIRDENGVAVFIVALRGGPVVCAPSLSEALTGLLEKVPAKS